LTAHFAENQISAKWSSSRPDSAKSSSNEHISAYRFDKFPAGS
jgi:hypothetical protein